MVAPAPPSVTPDLASHPQAAGGAPTPAATPLPDEVNAGFFTAVRDPEDPSIYRVSLDSGENMYVTAGVVRSIVNAKTIPEDVRAQALRAAPDLDARAYDGLLKAALSADTSQSYGEPTILETRRGKFVISDDPLLAGNVVMSRADGTIVGSMNLQAAMAILNKSNLSSDQKVEAFETFPLNVPNELREDFKGLTRPQQLQAMEKNGTSTLFRLIRKNEVLKVIPSSEERRSSPTRPIGGMAAARRAKKPRAAFVKEAVHVPGEIASHSSEISAQSETPREVAVVTHRSSRLHALRPFVAILVIFASALALSAIVGKL